MSVKTPSVYQFKITLMGSKPSIWRRIVVPEQFTFWDLHGAIQDSMGWGDLHPHQFRIYGHRLGSAKHLEKFQVKSDKMVKIYEYFDCIDCKAIYEYDFENGWEHGVVLESVIQEAEGCGDHPRCLGGKRACPPENCGGLNEFQKLLTVLADPKHEEHRKMREWVKKSYARGFKFEKFDPKSVEFNHFAFGELAYRTQKSNEDDSIEDTTKQVVVEGLGSQENEEKGKDQRVPRSQVVIRVSPRLDKGKLPARFANYCM